jgi:hypothetical protein
MCIVVTRLLASCTPNTVQLELAQCGHKAHLGMARQCYMSFSNIHCIGRTFIASASEDVFETENVCWFVHNAFPLISFLFYPRAYS